MTAAPDGRLPHPVTGEEFASPVPPGSGWPGDPATPKTPVAHDAEDVERLAKGVDLPTLDARIADTYAKRSTATNKNSLYDSYIRAIRWASDRIGDRGIIGFVTNGGWIDANTADGLRLSLTDEYTSLYIYNLRGNGRVAGEEGRKEGRPIFEFGGWRNDGTEIKDAKGGSRATIAIMLLVKNPESHESSARIHYGQVPDYLSAGGKVRILSTAENIQGLSTASITPDSHGDWINQRNDILNRPGSDGGSQDCEG